MLTRIALLVYTVIVLIPPLIHGYIYPSIGDDAAMHLNIILQIKQGIYSSDIIYYGQVIIGYPLAILSEYISLTQLYLWFSYLVLIFVGFTFYYVVSRLVNKQAGILALFLPIFGIGAIIFQWYAGTIFNIINIGVLVWGIYFAIRFMERHQWQYLIAGLLLFALSILIHPSGYYLPAIVIGLVLSQFAKYSEFRFVIVALSTAICLAIVSSLQIGLDPYRQLLDFGTMIALFIAGIVGILLKQFVKAHLSLVTAIIVLAVSTLPSYHWIADYNNALKPIDIEVIKYLDQMPGKYYSCSPEVAYWIYDKYTTKQYQEGALPCVVRNIPMTQRTLPDSKWYWYAGKQFVIPPIDNAVKFEEGETIIYVIP